ncbi:MAG: hypothetical protein KC582_00355 [Candidatus Magasanikbacteria bacterium]|nr:hypothetical protein [Candidatus Magasanikbacteria bacterium]
MNQKNPFDIGANKPPNGETRARKAKGIEMFDISHEIIAQQQERQAREDKIRGLRASEALIEQVYSFQLQGTNWSMEKTYYLPNSVSRTAFIGALLEGENMFSWDELTLDDGGKAIQEWEDMGGWRSSRGFVEYRKSADGILVPVKEYRTNKKAGDWFYTQIKTYDEKGAEIEDVSYRESYGYQGGDSNNHSAIYTGNASREVVDMQTTAVRQSIFERATAGTFSYERKFNLYEERPNEQVEGSFQCAKDGKIKVIIRGKFS